MASLVSSYGQMRLYRIKLRPLSFWRTPWQSDTLAGMLCWVCARYVGEDVLREEIIRPALEGRPRFVVSDAFPGDLLPLPVVIRLLDWGPDDRKEVKKGGYIQASSFLRVQRGERPELADVVRPGGAVRSDLHVHNTLDRMSDTTSDGGGLFTLSDHSLCEDYDGLTIYVRLEQGFENDFMELLGYLADTGFGADVSTGMGQFEIASGLEPANDLEDIGEPADGVIVLSTFQPGHSDPVHGVWEAFTKYGKIGPDFGLDNVFKRPIVMFRPGACFMTTKPRQVLGRAIPMQELLAAEDADSLRAGGAEIAHLAFGLAVPARLGGILAGSSEQTEIRKGA